MSTLPVPAQAGSEDAGLRLFRKLEEAGAVTKTSLSIKPGALSQEQTEMLGRMLGAARRSADELRDQIGWVIGDLLVYSEKSFGDDFTYGDLAVQMGLAYQTVMNMASVSRRVPPSRRIIGVKWSVHETVARLPADDQKKWLRQVRDEGMSRSELREQLKLLEPPKDPPPPSGEPNFALLVAAARDLLANCDEGGENVIVRRYDVVRLRNALGE